MFRYPFLIVYAERIKRLILDDLKKHERITMSELELLGSIVGLADDLREWTTKQIEAVEHEGIRTKLLSLWHDLTVIREWQSATYNEVNALTNDKLTVRSPEGKIELRPINHDAQSTRFWGDFEDSYGRECFISEGFRPKEQLWIGTPEDRLSLDKDTVARLLPLLTHFANTGRLPDGHNGPQGYQPDEATADDILRETLNAVMTEHIPGILKAAGFATVGELYEAYMVASGLQKPDVCIKGYLGALVCEGLENEDNLSV